MVFFAIPDICLAQVITVTGFVNNAADGKALKNISVFDEKSNIGTITNQNGYFKLTLAEGYVKLNITESGFQFFTEDIEIKSDTTLAIKLLPEISHKSRQKHEDELHAGGTEIDKKTQIRQGFKLF